MNLASYVRLPKIFSRNVAIVAMSETQPLRPNVQVLKLPNVWKFCWIHTLANKHGNETFFIL